MAELNVTKIFAVWDSKAEAYMQPFFASTVGLALRIFSDNVANQDSVLFKYPDDFVLFEIGLWDERTGEMINHEANINLGMAREYHPSKNLEAVSNA